MIEKPLDQLSKEELIVELQTLAEVRRNAAAVETDREQLIHDLHVHQIELEMQNRELRETQSRLEEARLLYTDLYDFAPVGYCTLTPEGRIREINLTGAAFFGVTRDQLLGKSLHSAAALKAMRPLEEHLKRGTEEKGRVTTELTFVLGRRGERTVQLISEPILNARGSVTAYRTVFVDISELKGLEHKLQLLARAGEVLSSSLDYGATMRVVVGLAVPTLADLCMVDMMIDDGKQERLVAFANARKQEMLAERLKEFYPRSGWQTTPARVFASGEPLLFPDVSAEVLAGITHDKRHFDALTAAGIQSLMVVPLSARGHTFGAVSLAAAESGRRYSTGDLRLAQDLANRAAMAVDNARLYAAAQKAIGARDVVIAVVSHDLRNPLSTIRLATSAMLETTKGEQRAEDHRRIERIRRSAEQMDRMVEDLLDVSRIEAGQLSLERRPQTVGVLLSDAFGSLQPLAAAKSLRLESDLPAGDRFDVYCDRERVLQVLTNLIGNAIKFTPAGGRITVRVEPSDSELRFAITDTGPGIAPDDLTHVFDRYWRAHRTGRTGAGLGLSIAKGIVEGHGGRIWVESRPGWGSTFIFTLPVAREQTTGAGDDAAKNSTTPSRNFP